MNPALIQAGGSILGGLLGKSKALKPSESMLSHVKGVMQASERFGFNPLTLLGVANPGHYGADNSSMGAAVSDAAMYLGDALAKKTDAAKLQQVAAERDRLQDQVVGLTVRPKVPGIYGPLWMGGPRAPAAASSGGVSSTGGPARTPVVRAGGDPRPLIETHPLDERRDVDNKAMTTTGGFMTVSNPNLPFDVYVPTLDGDEALDVTQWPTAALALGTSGALWAGGAMRNATDRMGWTTDGRNSVSYTHLTLPTSDLV